ncbi:class II aaRS and biotin synthetase [Morchella conica CCBAS932]|uniref:threonine--tRNA ligase n=1 Tax=Morchella conica CCBAS932 TaxID=1392247 RepID=A0A3N4KCI0_9PEZI|nr:class II aaRS and biotin synthetase [Morchella conica CCBAS932]
MAPSRDTEHLRNASGTTPPTASAPNDHRAIATSQELLITHGASPGSPLFLPNGARIFNKLQSLLRAQYAVYGYEEVITPTIYKRSLWETSGHWENYKDDMFSVSARGEKDPAEEVEEGEGEYGLKPMNCPGHCLLFKHAGATRSFRDLPVRYADFAPLHRNELSGALSGLTRVRKFHQDDAHIFCRPSQISTEILATLRLINTVYTVLHLPQYKLVLSTRPAHHIGTPAEWNRAEDALTQALNASGTPWTLSPGDGAFYGPKIDVLVTDSDGKQHQTATIQLDFQLPQRFGLSYLAPAPEAEARGEAPTDPKELETSGLVTPVIIHRAVLGSFERFMALLMEHYGGRWPFWLAPRQAVVLPVANSEKLLAYAREVRGVVAGVGEGVGVGVGAAPMGRRTFAVDVDESGNSLAKKVKAARVKGIRPYDVFSGVVYIHVVMVVSTPRD